MTQELQERLDSLIESESQLEWRPFPEQYMTKPAPPTIHSKQMSPYPSVHVIAKVTDDLTVHENYTQDVQIEGVPYKLHIWDTAGQEKYRGPEPGVFKAGTPRPGICIQGSVR